MPPDQTISALGWTFDVSVTPYDGFVARNVKLGPRYMADQISVPYFTLQTTALATPVHGGVAAGRLGQWPKEPPRRLQLYRRRTVRNRGDTPSTS